MTTTAEPEHKTCARCNESRPAAAYPRDGKGRQSPTCHVCRNARRRARGESAKRRARETVDDRRARLLREFYGLSVEQYEALVAAQQGRCAICAKEPGDGRRLAVDHCHDTGVVRALLCTACNTAVGTYEIYRNKAEEYLAKYGAGNPLLKQ